MERNGYASCRNPCPVDVELLILLFWGSGGGSSLMSPKPIFQSHKVRNGGKNGTSYLQLSRIFSVTCKFHECHEYTRGAIQIQSALLLCKLFLANFCRSSCCSAIWKPTGHSSVFVFSALCNLRSADYLACGLTQPWGWSMIQLTFLVGNGKMS